MPPPTYSQQIIWTAVSNGTAGSGTVQLSVAIAPRLVSTAAAATLADYPDWLNWPATAVTFTVTIGTVTIPTDQVTVVPPAVPLPSGVTSSQLWQLLFAPTTPVNPYTFSSFAGQLVRSYPAYYVRQFHVSTYTDIAANHPTAWPSYEELFGPFDLFPVGANGLPGVVADIDTMLEDSRGAIPPATSPDPATDLVQAYLYTQPLGPGTSPPPETLVPDFHQIVSSLGKYPVLLRAFGLVVDLQVALPSPLSNVVGVSVTPTWTPALPPPGTTQNFMPVLRTTSATFLPAPRPTDPEINGGYLKMNGTVADQPEYALVELDLDGSAAKTLNFAQAIPYAQNAMASQDTPTDYAVPALRSSGLTLVRTGQAADFVADQSTQEALNSAIVSATPPTLYAEDVTQGYRLDVLDETTNRWYQLCARVAAGTVYGAPAPTGYVVGTGGAAVVVPLPTGTAGSPSPGPGETGAPFDEGWVELSLTQSPPGVTPVSDLYLHETVCRWTGWSLVADRPGMHWAEDSNTPSANSYNPPNATTDVALQAAHAAAPGTLPVLRYGRTYRVGARAVDLAGNSLNFEATPSSASLKWATAPLRYGRLEPVATPVVVPQAPRTPGEHLLQMVIRSETYATPDGDVTPCQRHLAPASLAEEMAEAHGLFDLDGVPNGNLATYDLIGDRVGLTYATDSVVTSLGGVQDTPVLGGYNWPAEMYYYPAASLAVPYLPDVFCRGATFQNLPGTTATSEPVQVTFADGSTPWPAVRPLALVLNAGTSAPALENVSGGKALQVYLPPGSTQTALLSAYLHDADLDAMALWEWLGEAGLQTDALKSLVTTGQHWMFTPFRQLELVHAVRTPNPPAFTDPSITTRLPGKTYALFNDTIDVDFAGSSKLDLMATWTTPYDDGTDPKGAVLQHGQAHVADLPLELADPVPQSVAVSGVRHEFGDTKYRAVTYRAQTTTRFLEYFEETVAVTLTGTTPAVVNAGGMAEGATVVSEAVAAGLTPGPAYQPGIDYTEDDPAGTVTRIAGGAIPDGASVDVRFVAPTVTNTSAPATVTVPSTARPAVADIEYVLPIFSFDTTTSGSQITSSRTGNALRVYLARPWYSSGADEQLGVVIWPSGTPPATLTNLVTAYGRDPIWRTNATSAAPGLADFPLAATGATGIDLAEAAGLAGGPYPVDIAGHTVQFEPTSHLLWFADVEIDSSTAVGFSYFPFIRLALVRYQPNSITGYEVSPVSVADVVQVAPDRTATLTFPTTTTVNVSVAGVGAAAGTPIGVPPNAMTATVQEQQAGVTDPDLQWVDVAGTEVTLAASESAGYAMVWSGTVTLPAPRGSQPMRIRLTELEHHLYAPPGTTTPTYTSRIVYLDTLEI